MKKILITGALGQIGSELTSHLRNIYGVNNVVASSKTRNEESRIVEEGPFEIVDVLKVEDIAETVKKYDIDSIIHLAALLSAVGEGNPALAWKVNVDGLFNVLEVARETKCAVFTPSSIAAFGPSTPPDKTPQDTLQRPTTMYGVTKVSGELLCDYYFKKFGVDTRGVRYPGLISYETLPGGGTTDYAVHIYYDAIQKGKFTCYLKEGTAMDMMYMPDALDAIVQLMEADPNKLVHRNAFNITAMSFTPEKIFAEIKKHLPEFSMDYHVDPIRQEIADSWPNSLDDSVAREEWGWNPKYDLSSMTVDMLAKLREKLCK
ncbi:nucleoside-diphosphate-sugar epimerase [Anaerosolibacter carboniphilus]|uniref:Nucleoside-diphosphate-sugar epimerase n=1 Tax=Anaerosolibacter carboniphilus TaxID=1417629 RepID=A0A841KUJ9_9FIRM|nr:L-threonine 3-dehydrogenase [Anaerosolibacter carboniphilus]MBB6215690.1 nucleoside-diphosphate-sugar epimerase [Anaerosolibacter carboniphilus]